MYDTQPIDLTDLPELMIAGPGELRDDVLDAVGRQVVAHYGDRWMELHDRTIDRLGEFLGVADRPYVIPGTGTTCLDAAVANLFEPGQTVVVANTGFFGTRLMEIAAAHRLQVTEISPQKVGAPIDAGAIADAARGADGVLTVHVETATGTRHPIEDIARAAHDAGALYVVDGIASVGGELLRVDDMGIDAVVTGTQKGLESPPGLGIIALGPGGRERVDARSEPPYSWYLDLKRWDWYRREWPWHPHPVTFPSTLLLPLAVTLERILSTGMDKWVAARAELAHRLRDGLGELGLAQVPPPGAEANLIVAAWTDQADTVIRHLLDHERIMVSAGLVPTLGKAIRVGLMGRTATEQMVDRVIDGVAAALAALPETPASPAV